MNQVSKGGYMTLEDHEELVRHGQDICGPEFALDRQMNIRLDERGFYVLEDDF